MKGESGDTFIAHLSCPKMQYSAISSSNRNRAASPAAVTADDLPRCAAVVPSPTTPSEPTPTLWTLDELYPSSSPPPTSAATGPAATTPAAAGGTTAAAAAAAVAGAADAGGAAAASAGVVASVSAAPARAAGAATVGVWEPATTAVADGCNPHN